MSNIEFDASDVFNNLNNLINDLPQKLAKGIDKATLYIEGEAKKNCPVDDGVLRASITHYVEIEETRAIGYVGSNLEYAPYVHQGTGIYALEGKGRKEVPWTYKDIKGEWHTTSGLKPVPFLQNAIDANQHKLADYFKGILGE